MASLAVNSGNTWDTGVLSVATVISGSVSPAPSGLRSFGGCHSEGSPGVGRAVKVKKLQSRIRMICRRYGEVLDDAASADDAEFVRLQNELVDNTEKLFVFVLHPEVEATNNRSERQARSESMARKAARTSKTERGAKRRGGIMSVLASLSKRLEQFTLGSVLAEINHWFDAGRSVFREELAKLQAITAAPSRAPP